MENKFKLTNVVLYAKGWYKKTDDIWEDLRKILELDGYAPYDKMDIYNILLSATQNSDICHWTELKKVLNAIHPQNCWKYGYFVKDNAGWASKPASELPEYDMPTAFVYYVLSNLRFMERTNWESAMPKVTKYPKNPNIPIRTYYEFFCRK